MPFDDAEAVITRAALDLAAHLHEAVCASPGGGLFWVTGPKASGKTLVGVKLVEYLQNAAIRVAAVQPRLQRAEITLGKLVSRAGPECEARPYASPDELRGGWPARRPPYSMKSSSRQTTSARRWGRP